jgi:hypothetical protein
MRTLLLLLASSVAFSQNNPATAAPNSPGPDTQKERLLWATYTTIGPPNLIAGAITAAISTGRDTPPEYGPHWGGYFKRQGLRLTGTATSNVMEAAIGDVWGEDPRYRRSTGKTGPARVWYAVKTAFIAYNRDGKPMPAYARFIAIPTSNVIANSWRPDSERTAGQTTTRISLGFISRIASNSFQEFWPDIHNLAHKK